MRKWYPVPPYANEGWKMYNEKGEWIATFEDQSDCELAAELYNAHILLQSFYVTTT